LLSVCSPFQGRPREIHSEGARSSSARLSFPQEFSLSRPFVCLLFLFFCVFPTLFFLFRLVFELFDTPVGPSWCPPRLIPFYLTGSLSFRASPLEHRPSILSNLLYRSSQPVCLKHGRKNALLGSRGDSMIEQLVTMEGRVEYDGMPRWCWMMRRGVASRCRSVCLMSSVEYTRADVCVAMGPVVYCSWAV